MKALVSAPGKITLFGEHAVVYGQPALVAAVDKRVYAFAEKRNDNVVKISARDLKIPGIIVSYVGEEVILETDYGLVFPAISYINKAIEIVSDFLGVKKGINIEIRSDMPVGAGLGTSAAVAITTIAAYAAVNGYNLEKVEIAELGWRVEKTVQGIASPMDTSIATFGGFLKIRIKEREIERTSVHITNQLPLIVGYVERGAKTKDMVAKVRERLMKQPEIYGKIIELIGEVTEKGHKALENGDLRAVGEYMNLNHSLLEALGVSTRKLNELVYLAREAGAYGAKLTGAGGGGCVIALVPENKREVELAMKIHGSLVFDANLSSEGIRIERVETA